MNIIFNTLMQYVLLSSFNSQVFSAKVIQCKPPEIKFAFLSCSTNPLSNGNYINLTSCVIICKEGYVRLSQPATIDCYRSYWLLGGSNHIPYTEEAIRCIPQPVRLNGQDFGRSDPDVIPFLPNSPESHDGMCSNDVCERRYPGITSRVCGQFGCCWDKQKRDCFQYLPSRCQVSKLDRFACPGSWKGISQRLCENRNCCFDDADNFCYSSKKNAITKPPSIDRAVTAEKSVCDDVQNLLPNGSVTCDQTGELKICTGVCHQRFMLEGDNIRVCNVSSQQWSLGTWNCKANSCVHLTSMKGTYIECTDRFKVGSVCTASCALGYELPSDGHFEAQCLQTGEWSKPTSWKCQDIECSELDVSKVVLSSEESLSDTVPNLLCTNGRKYGSVCSVKCPVGYIAVGSQSIRCEVNGKWSSGAFHCMPSSCPSPRYQSPSVQFTCTKSNKVGSVCKLSCSPGRVLIGPKEMICQANQKWSGTPGQANCEESKECKTPFLPSGASIDCTDGYAVGSLCTIQCPAGTTLRGLNNQIVTCLDTLRWHNNFEKEECVDITTKPCDIEIDLSNGKITPGDKSYEGYVRIVKEPKQPAWKRFMRMGKSLCDHQSVLEVQYGRMNAFTFLMRYNIPNRYHFGITSGESELPGKSIWAKSFQLNGLPNSPRRGLIPSNSNIRYVLRKSDPFITYMFGVAGRRTLPIDFGSEKTILIGLNRAVAVSSEYDIGNTGEGMCNFCLTFSKA